MNVPFNFRLAPFAHQRAALQFVEGRPHYALLMEQGTGKTAVAIWDFARRYMGGTLDGALVVAPNGVQSNWVLRELPAHWPDEAPCLGAAWVSGANKREEAEIKSLFAPEARNYFRTLTMNWEALNTEDGYETAVAFMRSLSDKGGIAGDESQRFKNPSAKRTKAFNRLKPLAKALRVIMSGTPILKSPWDAYSQFSWLDQRILGTTSYWAFKAEYAELLPPGHGLLRHIAQRTNSKVSPQIVARDTITGLPKWRNLEKLEQLIAPHSFRVLKKDCLDLPDKVYTQRWFRMTPKQQVVYDRLKEEFRLLLADGEIAPVERLGALTKLSQVVSGYFLIPGTKTQQRIMALENNPKFDVLMETLESCLEADEQVIIWARFQAELKDIATVLTARRWPFVEYHGEIGSKTARQEAIDSFERGEAKIFLSQQAAGGTGLTLIAKASVATSMSVIYFSNTFNLEDRVQSEDRAHRIGQQKTVRYVDIMAENSIDSDVINSLRNKIDIASIVTGDARRAAELMGLVR
jgi:SNF2 family DNA or RNA helicase